jgi:hypothetical protein
MRLAERWARLVPHKRTAGFQQAIRRAAAVAHTDRSDDVSALTGQIGPGGISATVKSQFCNYQLTLKRQG